MSHKSKLNELSQKIGGIPVYKVVNYGEQNKSPYFMSECSYNGFTSYGSAITKKGSEEEAAANMLISINTSSNIDMSKFYIQDVIKSDFPQSNPINIINNQIPKSFTLPVTPNHSPSTQSDIYKTTFVSNMSIPHNYVKQSSDVSVNTLGSFQNI